jgi:hypothetical protein
MPKIMYVHAKVKWDRNICKKVFINGGKSENGGRGVGRGRGGGMDYTWDGGYGKQWHRIWRGGERS